MKTWELDRVNDEKFALKKTNTTLKQNVESLAEEEERMKQLAKNQSLVITQLRKKAKETNTTVSKGEKKVSFDENALATKDIDKKLEKFTSNILEQVTHIVETKLSVLTKLENIPQEITDNCNSFKAALTKTNPRDELKLVMTESKNDELLQQRERKLRSCNIIIHGVEEEKENSTETDEQFVTEFLSALGVNQEPKSTVRLGRAENNKRRPLRLTMNTDEEKDTVMARLPNLKNAEDKLKMISVTDDYTVDERNEIKTWVEKAKKKNEKETGDVVWKVRGTPKNGLRLAKFPKRTPRV